MFSEAPEKFLMMSSVGIHSVSSDGIILYANQCELEVLGYTKEEYVGHHTSEFQMDKNCFDDMMKRLSKFENLKNYPARVQGKNSIKYILYNTSVFHEGGRFIHTRCYGVDVDERAYEVFKEISSYF